jgi:WD40 repeat protein
MFPQDSRKSLKKQVIIFGMFLSLFFMPSDLIFAQEHITAYPQLGHKSGIKDLIFSPDGRLIASCSNDFQIKIWDVQTLTEIGNLKGHTDWVRSIVFNKSGTELLSASDDKTIKLWDIAERRELKNFTGHSDMVMAAVFSPDEKNILSFNDAKIITIFDRETALKKASFEANGSISAISYTASGRSIIYTEANTIKMFDAETGNIEKTYIGHEKAVNCFSYNADKRYLVSGSEDQTIKIWDMTVISSNVGVLYSGEKAQCPRN